MNDTESRDIVLIHGLFLNWQCWSDWVERYTAAGHRVHAIGWPGMKGNVAELRADPSPMKGLTLKEVLGFYENYVGTFSTPPIVIGHSFGGLFAQLLAYKKLVSAAVALDPVAPAGLYELPFSSLKAALPVFWNPLGVNEATMLTPEQFRYGFTNTETEERSRAIYDELAIPCVNRVFFEGFVENFNPGSVGHIDVSAPRSPVLLIGGGEDHIVTPGYTRAHYDLIAKSPSITAHREYAGRPHFSGGVTGWETIADESLAWALQPATIEPATHA